ncbi:unnamed protein product [Protopolystoma xenopodis]|uniref:Uncharacterized protein n=1 Tax=Protopolystoma xenopodis TaxID=117903 RepID=A0A3S5FGB6_9PLAT|nr:unnamed protein product [Protopolystoma xenopodis]
MPLSKKPSTQLPPKKSAVALRGRSSAVPIASAAKKPSAGLNASDFLSPPRLTPSSQDLRSPTSSASCAGRNPFKSRSTTVKTDSSLISGLGSSALDVWKPSQASSLDELSAKASHVKPSGMKAGKRMGLFNSGNARGNTPISTAAGQSRTSLNVVG